MPCEEGLLAKHFFGVQAIAQESLCLSNHHALHLMHAASLHWGGANLQAYKNAVLCYVLEFVACGLFH